MQFFVQEKVCLDFGLILIRIVPQCIAGPRPSEQNPPAMINNSFCPKNDPTPVIFDHRQLVSAEYLLA